MHNFENLLLTAIKASVAAGEKILSIYNSDIFQIRLKQDDSPITIADSEANSIITQFLEKTGLPIITEENDLQSFEIRKKWEFYWLVDPLDGTKEFIQKNGEFTVNIALIKKNEPLFGVIYVPVQDILYFSENLSRSFKLTGNKDMIAKNDIDLDQILKKSSLLPLKKNMDKLRVIGSRSHHHSRFDELIGSMKEKYGEIEILSKGSSLKFCMLAEGIADFYPRYSPTMEWDTAAGHAIAVAAGCFVTNIDGNSPLLYNKLNMLNPGFMVRNSNFKF